MRLLIAGARSATAQHLRDLLARPAPESCAPIDEILLLSRQMASGRYELPQPPQSRCSQRWHYWRDPSSAWPEGQIDTWVSLVPIFALPQLLGSAPASALPRRLLAVSSTSVLTKASSPCPRDRAQAAALLRAEQWVLEFSAQKGIDCLLVRPTLVFGGGRDKTLGTLAWWARRVGWIPLPPGAGGLRQPIRDRELAAALERLIGISDWSSLRSFGAPILTLTGPESISLRDCAVRIQRALGQPVRLVECPAWLLSLLLRLAQVLPRSLSNRLPGPGAVARMTAPQTFSSAALRAALGLPSGPLRIDGADVQAPLVDQEQFSAVKRFVDLLSVGFACPLAVPLLALLMLAVRLDSPGPALHWSRRVGRGGRLFWMPKLRSMRIDAPDVPTDALQNPQAYITRLGGLLRRSSLDELPQLYSILVGDMSLVGPRPALHSQADLLDARAEHGALWQRPGLTGLAQVMGRDELPIDQKVAFDAQYVRDWRLKLDFWILWRTLVQVLQSSGVRH